MAQPAAKHWPQLDGLRGIAILLVMAYHFMDLLTPFHPAEGWPRFTWAIGGAGWIGVDLFFVLSGFLITGILFDAKGDGRYFSSFYMRRLLRIFPLYYGILLAVLVVVPLVRMPDSADYRLLHERQAWYWTYATNWLIALNGDFSAAPAGFFWSLAVEEQFYLAWPLVVCWLGRSSLLRLCIGLVVAGPVVRLLLQWAGCTPATVYVMTLTHLEPLAIGAAVALALRGPMGERALPRWWRAAGWGSAGLLALLFVWRGQFKFWDPMLAGVATTLLALAFGVCLHHIRVSPPTGWARRFCQLATLQSFGRLSYALYLFHLPVAAAVRKFLYDPLPALQGGEGFSGPLLLFMGLATGGSWAAAWVSWHLFEKHFMGLKRFFPATAKPREGKPQPAVTVAA